METTCNTIAITEAFQVGHLKVGTTDLYQS